MHRILLSCLFFPLLISCSSQGVNRSDINQFVEVIYAQVVNTKPVKLDSKSDEAAATGAIDGAIENSDGDGGDIISGAISSALVSALFVSIEEGSRDGLLVDMIAPDQTPYHIIVKRTDIHPGDCLQLIKGVEVSVMHVTADYCVRTSAVSLTANPADGS